MPPLFADVCETRVHSEGVKTCSYYSNDNLLIFAEELAPRERDVYYITKAGRRHFHFLLREALGTYTPGLNEMEACLFFLRHLAPAETISCSKNGMNLPRATVQS